MARRIYLPSTGSAPVTPSTWNFASQVNPLTFRGVTTRISSTMTSKLEATGTTSPVAKAMLRYVIGPLAGQSISGTVKGQMRGSESNAGANATLALAAKLIKPDGTDRAVLLAQTASDAATTGHELTTVLTNMSFQNASEVAAMPITTQTATAGDYLVLEIGFRSATTTTRDVTLSYGDDSATDLPEDTTTTAANNPWIEFSATIALLSTATATITTGRATAAGSATFSSRYTATAAVTTGPATVAGTATFTAPVMTAAAAVSVGAATVAATGVVGSHPVGKITQQHGYLSGKRYLGFTAKTPTPFIFAGSAVIIVSPATASGTAFFAPVRTASAALTAPVTTVIAAAMFVHAHPAGKITQPHAFLSGRRYGSFAGRGSGPYTAAATVTAGRATVSGLALFLPPVYHGTAAVLAKGAIASGSGSFTSSDVATADGNATAGAATATGLAQYVSPAPIRPLVLVGRVENNLSLFGKIENALSLVGSITVSSLPQSLSCVYGERVTITVTMDIPPEGGVAAWVLGFWLKKSQGSAPPAVVVTKTSGSGIVTTDADNGVFTITLNAADTKQTPGSYQFDFWRTDNETALAQGRFSIGDTTRP